MAMLKFRNINITPDDPVEKWGVEGILCAFERGNVEDWRKIWRSIHIDKSEKVEKYATQAKNMLQDGDLGFAISRVF